MLSELHWAVVAVDSLACCFSTEQTVNKIYSNNMASIMSSEMYEGH